MSACPICETPNPEDAAECETCGKVLLLEGDLEVEEEPMADLEQTLLDPLDSVTGPVVRLAEVEDTQLADRRMEVQVEAVEVERTKQEEGPASTLWFGGLADMESGRESDGMAKTAAPVDPGKCVWCGVPGTGVLCDGCGRRRLRGQPARPAAARAGAPMTAQQHNDAAEDTVLCPGCLTRVQRVEKCPECMTPLPRGELF
jgi:hypothetical protein